MDETKIIQFAKAKLNDETDLFLLDEIEATKQMIDDTNTRISQLTEEVKKKEAEEIAFEIDPAEIKGEKGDKGDTVIGPVGPIGPMGPKPVPGVDYKIPKDGYTPIKNIDYFDGKDGIGVKGDKGDKGDKGEVPKHEWSGTYLRFEKPDGTWGDWINLRGEDGRSYFGGGGSSVQIKSGGRIITTSASSIDFNNLTVTNNDGRVSVTAQIPEVDNALAIAYAIVL